MAFKKLVILLIVLIIVAAYGIGGSDKISKYVEEKTKDTEEPNAEKVLYYNIVYMNWTAKNQRALELIEKYVYRYSKSERMEDVLWLKARTLDNMMDDKAALVEYELYAQEYPEGKKIKTAKRRVRELKTNF